MNLLCLAEKEKHDLSDLSNSEFEKIVFAGAGMSEHRGPSDAFSFEEMVVIVMSEAYSYFSRANQDFLWAAYISRANPM